MLLAVLSQQQMYVANIRTLKLNGAHLRLQGIDDPGSQATHTNTIATDCVFSFNY
jgi:hypothetical protein